MSSAFQPGSAWAWDSPQAAAADAGLYDQVREALAQANYSDAGIARALGLDTLSRLGERRLAALLRRTGGGSPLETLIRLFVLDQPVARTSAQRAVGAGALEAFSALGLLRGEGEAVRAVLQLRCWQGLVLAWDFARRGPGGLREDYVMGVSPSSLLLAAMTPRRRVEAVFDLGSGCGIQALLAAAHGTRVVGADCNPRAVAVANFNARLNRCVQVEFRLGDMFAPVAGEPFDLIVSNPPFIITPDTRHLFLTSGAEADEVCRTIIAAAPRHLREGGWCILTANWAVAAGEDWAARLRSWCEGSGCDALVLHESLRQTDEYAAGLIEVAEDDAAAFDRAFASWMDYYDRRGFVAIGQGVIALRRASGRSHWFGVETAPLNLAMAAGDDLERIFAQRTWLHGLDGPADLLASRLRLAPGVRLEQDCECEGGGWRPRTARLHRTAGLHFAGSIDATGAALLAGFDGTRSVRDQIERLAGMVSAEAAALTPAALATVRRLTEQGFLTAACE
ncbi:MAG TPA: class I SAM-dependent methyltransferase [Terriglobales bacterium]|nr:class I SAM-dependent methyltransferase [Terriglobales bacterium]